METRLGPTKVVAAFESRGDHRFAFVMSQTALDLFDFSHLNLRNSRVFRDHQYDQAKRWLLFGEVDSGAG